MNIDLDQLAERLPEQRWYGGKSATIDRIDLIDAAVIDPGPPDLVLAIVNVIDHAGTQNLYHYPLLVESDGSSRDAFDDVDRFRCFGNLLATGATVKGERGSFMFTGPGLDPLSPPGQVSARTMGAEQTNTSLVLDEEVIVKLLRRVDWGRNPDLELTRHLTTEGFEHIPTHVGEVMYETDEEQNDERQVDLCIAQQFMTDSVEGWQDTLKRLHQLYDAIDDADVHEDMRFLTEERASENLASLEDLGEVTASLHISLARDELEHDLAPEPIDPDDLAKWADRANTSLDALLAKGEPELEPLKDALEERIDRLRDVKEPGQKSRIHSDYHLGQVLMTQRGWMILDFEGEPARSLEERRTKQSPLRDVAGMLRSFSYAAVSALFERAEPDSEQWRDLEGWADTWETLARERFLHGYRARAHEGRFSPQSADDLSVMLDVFEIDKALYELGYERGHRPDWARIPLHGIVKVLGKEVT
ncbi:MAG: phosphotransferase [Actinomycetota bacterium]